MNDLSVNSFRDNFSKAAREWLCESYHVEYRYVARDIGSSLEVIHAMVLFYPWMNSNQDSKQFNFHIKAGNFEIGQMVLPAQVLVEAHRVLDDALNGQINLPSVKMALSSRTSMYHYLRGSAPNPWINMIHMTVTAMGAEQFVLPQSLDDDLRRAEVPFDGYTDVLLWLGLNEFSHPGGLPSIAVIVHPPAQIAVQDGKLADENLNLVIDVMPSVDINTVSVAVMGSPPTGISLRKQLRKHLTWALQPDTKRVRGTGAVELPNAYRALVALSIGNTYVQRQWFSDPSLSKNVRFAATQEFDHDLTKIKARLNSTDSRVFEKAVAALMFLSGFAPLLPLEDEGPDIIGVTPGGQVVLVECTIKTPDAMAKIGNLVLRREALRAAFTRGKHSNTVMAVLVCQTPRPHIHASDVEIARHDVLLITQENLVNQVVKVQDPVDADELCMRGLERLNELKSRPTS
ncbi:hypothetical protein GCM10008098_11610 [Rhodanobacter panaciterrae]|uniref:Restriction endonuclease n=1 Tax=Rhodanobacter panaciterrae TaxID=490572 RepID=A0ABQ2ZRE3_9GAMM|nr:hypothetical protein [Rhodanobacter panaciterrae]GGY20669.1 hypothetical protein GCM10008098_11610 [Rhodanobacter panaciterrae]